ncbi:MAG TPA: molecular chaperone TorD family protein [Slackia equolifaciens]|uniref:Molecular chaperone TorD family protein n=1 Tax=Slackia equolifaciens TaxID=498718 RepID=A0A9D2UVJ7_9ACTN|nr:molecular chaperone TorD family protein [Slackia equolifaciens]
MDFDKETLQAAQAAFGFAAGLISQEPTEEWVHSCIDNDMFAAAPFGEGDKAVTSGLVLLSSWCAAARNNLGEETAAVQREWLRLFVGLGTPEAPVWESYYTEPNSTMFGRSTLEVRAAYKEWGLEFERKAHEPDDALGIMLAFCSYLMGRELDALEAFDPVAAAKAAQSLESFLVVHMLPWASAWRFLVKNHAKTDYYRGVGELVFGLERAYAKRFGIECNEEDGTFSYVLSAKAREEEGA